MQHAPWYNYISNNDKKNIIKRITNMIHNINYFLLPSDYNYHEDYNVKFLYATKPAIEVLIIDNNFPIYREEWFDETKQAIKEELENQFSIYNLSTTIIIQDHNTTSKILTLFNDNEETILAVFVCTIYIHNIEILLTDETKQLNDMSEMLNNLSMNIT
jgi:hypothetical protein